MNICIWYWRPSVYESLPHPSHQPPHRFRVRALEPGLLGIRALYCVTSSNLFPSLRLTHLQSRIIPMCSIWGGFYEIVCIMKQCLAHYKPSINSGYCHCFGGFFFPPHKGKRCQGLYRKASGTGILKSRARKEGSIDRFRGEEGILSESESVPELQERWNDIHKRPQTSLLLKRKQISSRNGTWPLDPETNLQSIAPQGEASSNQHLPP